MQLGLIHQQRVFDDGAGNAGVDSSSGTQSGICCNSTGPRDLPGTD